MSKLPITEHQEAPLLDMWDGLDRFCKVQEYHSHLSGQLRDFRTRTARQLEEIKTLIGTKVDAMKFERDLASTDQSLRDFVTSQIEGLKDRFDSKIL